MKALFAVLAIFLVAYCVVRLNAAPTPTTGESTAEIVKAMNYQNQQLKRIADSLERISGQQPGWKLPN
jgi:uncharacterized protein (UPF0210 family)